MHTMHVERSPVLFRTLSEGREEAIAKAYPRLSIGFQKYICKDKTFTNL